MSDASVRVERTGNVFSFAATEYRVAFPDGATVLIWSPPWHEMGDAEEDAAALEYASALWQAKQAGVEMPRRWRAKA